MTDLMTPTEVFATYPPIATCMYCKKPAPYGNAPHAICLRCLWCCHRCGHLLPLDYEGHHCQECQQFLADTSALEAYEVKHG